MQKEFHMNGTYNSKTTAISYFGWRPGISHVMSSAINLTPQTNQYYVAQEQ